MILLDTNVLSELMKPDPDARVGDWLMRIQHEPFATTVISLFEITYGIRRLAAGKRRTDLEKRFFSMTERLSILPLDAQAALFAGEFRALRDANGMQSTPSDMLIAGIAATHQAMLATRNGKDFKALPIRMIDPWALN